MSDESKRSPLSRRDFLKMSGLAGAAAVTAAVAGDVGRRAADAGIPRATEILVKQTLEKWSSGKWAVRTDELRLSQEEFDGRLKALNFDLLYDDIVPKIEPVEAHVFTPSNSTDQVVTLTSGDQQYSAQLRPYSFTDVNGGKHEGVFPEFIDSNGQRLETNDDYTGFERQLWTAAQQISKLTRQEAFTVYLGVAINDKDGKKLFTSPVTGEREGRESNHTYYSVVNTDRGPRYFVSTITRTGLKYIGENLSAEAVNPTP